MPKIVLHQWEMSPFCNKVRRCLRHKRLDYEVVNYNGLLARNAAKLSRAGTLPVLDYDEQRVPDSPAIVAFLERKHPDPPLLPAAPEERAAAHVWEDWAAQSLYFFELRFRMLDPVALEKALDLIAAGRPSFERALLKVAFKLRYPKKLAQQGLGKLSDEEAERQLLAHVDALEAILTKRPYLVGGALSVADLSVAAQLDELVRTSRLAGEILARPHVKDWLARV